MAAKEQNERARLALDSLERIAAGHRQTREAAHRADDHARQLELLPQRTDSPIRR